MSLRGDSGPDPLGAPMAAGRIWSRGLRSPPRSPVRWTPRLALVLYLVWTSGLTIAYFTVPGRPLLVWTALGLSSALAMLFGIRRHRPEQALPWYLLAAAVAMVEGAEKGLEWIDSERQLTAVSGWATLGSLLSIKPDAQLDVAALEGLLQRVQKTIHDTPDLARYQMNSFVIAVGSYVLPLSGIAIQTAEQIGPVMADLGNNACQVPFAPDYIRKMESRGSLGKKRKTAKC